MESGVYEKTVPLNTLAQSHVLDVSNGALDDIKKEAMNLQILPEVWGSYDRVHVVQNGLFHTSRTILLALDVTAKGTSKTYSLIAINCIAFTSSSFSGPARSLSFCLIASSVI